MKKITFLMLLSINFMFAQTATVDVSELSNVASVDILANFGGSFDFFPATDAGSNVWTFDFSPSGDVTNEYKWRVTFDDTTTQEEDLVPKVAGKGLDNDVAVGQDFNTNYFSFCNRVMTIGGDSQSAFFNSFRIPGVVYTWPEVAAVGKTEEELKEAGVAYKTGQFPMRALGRSRASMDLDGFVKVLADATTDEILGVHMIGARAADMIAEAVVAMEYRASAEDVSRMSHAHPTFTEAIKEAALAATDDIALHV